jgi:hypothetical protein
MSKEKSLVVNLKITGAKGKRLAVKCLRKVTLCS